MELVHIGHTRKARGIEGSFKLHVEDIYLDDLHHARALFISLDGSLVPFIIESVNDQKSLTIKVEDINNPEEAQQLLGKEIFLHQDEVSEKETTDSQHPLTGYLVIDQDKINIGIIDELLEYPDQLLAQIIVEGKQVLIPIHEDLILSLDDETRQIQLTIPEGLLSL